MKGKGKGKDQMSEPGWNPYKGKGKGQNSSWKGKGAWGKGKGAYAMEEDWGFGYSGYSLDSPLFASTLAEEAANDWKMVGSKKTNKPSRPTNKGPSRCGATSTCDYIMCPGYAIKRTIRRAS